MTNFEIQYLVTQYGMLLFQLALILVTVFFYRQLVANDNRRAKLTTESEIKHWCKCVFRQIDSPGGLQRAGSKTRKRFPNDVKLILIAYDELLVEEPNRDRPPLFKFLEYMDGVESGHWPLAAKAMADKLDLYNDNF